SAEAGYQNWDGGSSDQNGYGGAIQIQLSQYWTGSAYVYPYQSILINNTFVNNMATGSGNNTGNGGAISYEYSQSTALVNNIFWGNMVNNRGDSTAFEIDGVQSSQSEVIVGHNNFEYSASAANTLGSDNMSRDPKFMLDGSADEYQLSDASRLIGAGALVYNGYKAPAYDILGNARPTADPDRPDMGAYENSYVNPPYPDGVAGLTATSADQNVTLNWTANEDADLGKYVIYQSTVSGFAPTSADSIDEVAAGTNTYIVTGLTNRTNYYFRLAAMNTKGNMGDFSGEVSAMPEYLGPVWWVDDVNGSTQNGDGNSGSPFLSISSALAVAAANDT
ncbi:MAG TPA: hypothetical protein EYO88_00955, partial [Alphaproteobacteria bacterium]|nr:hypothetical protein [Alphaproteobacteria bacterium]